MKNELKPFYLFISLFSLFLLSGCDAKPKVAPAKPDDSKDIVVQNVQWAYDGGSGPAGIVGDVVNKSDKTYNSVFVKFNLYGPSGSQIDNVIVSVDDLEAGKSWHFAQALTDYQRQATDFKMMEINKYKN